MICFGIFILIEFLIVTHEIREDDVESFSLSVRRAQEVILDPKMEILFYKRCPYHE